MAGGIDPIRRPRRFKALSLTRLVPNVATIMGMCAGLTSIRFAMQDRWEAAVAAILIAGIIDGLDGRLAGFGEIVADEAQNLRAGILSLSAE
mgnify:CR=1 FL=1